MENQNFPLQVLRFPILVQDAQFGPWRKVVIRATNWEMAAHRVARDIMPPGGSFDFEEFPFNPLSPRAA